MVPWSDMIAEGADQSNTLDVDGINNLEGDNNPPSSNNGYYDSFNTLMHNGNKVCAVVS